MAAAAAAARRVLSSSLYPPRLGQCTLPGARSLCEAAAPQAVLARSKRACLVDTLSLVRRLEGEGVPSKHAEAVTAAIVEVLNDSLENVGHSFVSKLQMEKSVMVHEATVSKFQSEMRGSQEHNFTLLQRETEKLRGDIEKIRSELKHEMAKVTAGQRLDLNLERGRTRDELSKRSTESAELTNKLDHEIQAIRAQIEATKADVVKYCIGALASLSAVGLALLRVLK